MKIQKYLLTESTFDSYQINIRLGKIQVILLPTNIISSTVSPSIPLIIRSTSLVSNISTNNPFQPLPNINTPSSQGYGQKLANLVKMYTNKAKYSGKKDSFAFKLMIFHDICAKANVPEEILLKTFLTMLTSIAVDYYYSNTNIIFATTFDEIYDSIQIYFEA